MEPMIIAAAISAATSILSNIMSSSAEKEAAAQYLKAAEKSRAAYQSAYDQAFGVGSYNDKLQGLGVQAAQDYMNLVNDKDAWNRYVDGEKAYQAPDKFQFGVEELMQDPSYQFRMQEAQKALEQSQVAGGLNLSGAAAKDMAKFSQDLASTEFANAYNRNYKQFTDDRTFDYNKWLNESKQYYQNIISQMQGLDNINQTGIKANMNQAAALQGMANANSNYASQVAAANTMGNNAGALFGASTIDSLGLLGSYLTALYGTQGDNVPSVQGSTVATGTSPFETNGSFTVPGSGFTQPINAGWEDVLAQAYQNQNRYY